MIHTFNASCLRWVKVQLQWNKLFMMDSLLCIIQQHSGTTTTTAISQNYSALKLARIIRIETMKSEEKQQQQQRRHINQTTERIFRCTIKMHVNVRRWTLHCR